MTMMTATQALSVNPATGQTLAAMPRANAQEIEHALSLAASGFKKWKLASVAQRANITQYWSGASRSCRRDGAMYYA
ncbi:aldehyde dehydrogenase family protein [Salmonella enterica subsp. enterica serovar Worthington]|nr:aldehyde dehydrogenase family protein [Salmonella enterica subsp. enterica serovar Worthington]